MTRPAARAAAALVALVALAGCQAPAAAVRPATVPASAAASSAPVDLVALREQAGIADCPIVDADAVTPLADGLPDLTLDCLGSERTLNLAALRGTPMVVNLWAQWCPPCRAESPHLREFAQAAGDRVFVLGVNYADPQPDWAIEFAGLAGWTYPHVVDPDRRTLPGLRVQGIPMTLLVDAEGHVVHRFSGAFSSTQELTDLVAEHLGVRL